MHTPSCPNCGSGMVQKRSDTNREGGTTYDRTVFQCYKENVWVTVEIPREGK